MWRYAQSLSIGKDRRGRSHMRARSRAQAGGGGGSGFRRKIRMVFDHVFDGISIYQRLIRIPRKEYLSSVHDRYAAMAGRTREELFQLGSTQGLQITLEDTANVVRMESLTMGTSYQGTFSWIRPDGKNNVIEYVAMPITWRGKAVLDRHRSRCHRNASRRSGTSDSWRKPSLLFRTVFYYRSGRQVYLCQ